MMEDEVVDCLEEVVAVDVGGGVEVKCEMDHIYRINWRRLREGVVVFRGSLCCRCVQ
mgnify:FL=1|tara:strand:- start:555 stop:725 length:171 start_codon:yes stop_codon:yes gene_type:complete